MWAQYEVGEHGGTRNVFNKIPSGYQLRRVIEWQVNQSFENHLFSCHQEGKRWSSKRWCLAIQPPDAAASPRIFYSM